MLSSVRLKCSGPRLQLGRETAILKMTLRVSISRWDESPNEFASGVVMTAVTYGPFALRSYPASVEDAGVAAGTPWGQCGCVSSNR